MALLDEGVDVPERSRAWMHLRRAVYARGSPAFKISKAAENQRRCEENKGSVVPRKSAKLPMNEGMWLEELRLAARELEMTGAASVNGFARMLRQDFGLDLQRPSRPWKTSTEKTSGMKRKKRGAPKRSK